MPNFNTHWLVAISCIESGGLPDFIRSGFEKYCVLTVKYKNKILKDINAVDDIESYRKFIKSGIDDALNEYNEDLTAPENHDDITCFSAYMLGACGPDFWMVASKPRWWCIIPDFGEYHFDLGHYNRTHRQFQVAITRWRDDKSLSPLQIKVEQAYFYGMATHIAADLVIHQLVNVYAGAYNHLKKKWKNEHGLNPKGTEEKEPLFVKLWNTHNKVEQYWDSYIRYRYLGDVCPVFDKGDGKARDETAWATPLGFPTVESLCDGLEKQMQRHMKHPVQNQDPDDIHAFNQKAHALRFLKKALMKDRNKIRIEQPFIFPRIFCDRVTKSTGAPVKPFLYDIVVDKEKGAYEDDIIFKKAKKEAEHFQMKAGKVNKEMTFNEEKKLAYFGTDINLSEALPNTSFTFLNYLACPNLERVRTYGWNDFFHTQALRPFFKAALPAANRFVHDLREGIKKKDPNGIGILGNFWNLDTGLGISVVRQHSDTSNEIITDLRFIHVTEKVNGARTAYGKDTAYVKGMGSMPMGGQAETRAFETVRADPFDSLERVFEPDSNRDNNRYLHRLSLSSGQMISLPQCDMASFFTDRKECANDVKLVPTEKNADAGQTVLRHRDIKHRLSLHIKMPVAELAESDNLCFYLYNDSAIKMKSAADEVKAGDWLGKSRLIDYVETKNLPSNDLGFSRKNGLCFFETSLLMNLEPSKNYTREVAKGIWNNVIDYENKKDIYSRNYAVGTGRTEVLAYCDEGVFQGKRHFKVRKKHFPTEQVFFSVYPLVKTADGCFDMLSKERVREKDMKRIKRIESLGFVKIVLFYELSRKGAAQLHECLIDGIPVQVKDA